MKNPLTLASGYRSYIAGWSIVAVGVIGMTDPPYQVVFGESLWTVEAWNLLQQAVTPLIGLAVVFLRSAISKVSPMAADSLSPLLEKVITDALTKLLEQLKPHDGGTTDDLVFTKPPARLES